MKPSVTSETSVNFSQQPKMQQPPVTMYCTDYFTIISTEWEEISEYDGINFRLLLLQNNKYHTSNLHTSVVTSCY
jgi:hypothetical protein